MSSCNRFWKSKSEREQVHCLQTSNTALLGFEKRGGDGIDGGDSRGRPLRVKEEFRFRASHKENITPVVPRVALMNLRAKPDKEMHFKSNKQLVLRTDENDLSTCTASSDAGVGLGTNDLGHYEEAMRLVSERLANEIEAHMETHLSLEDLRDKLMQFEEKECKHDKKVDTLRSEIDVLKAKHHTRENEFVANIMKHQSFLQEERQKRLQVERDLYKALRNLAMFKRKGKENDGLAKQCQHLVEQNQSLEETLRKLTLVAKESEDEVRSLSKELDSKSSVTTSKNENSVDLEASSKALEEHMHELKDENSRLKSELSNTTEQLEEALGATQMYKEEIETKDVHCTFLQDQLSLVEASLTDKEKELEELKGKVKKFGEVHSTSANFVQLNEDLINELEQKENELSEKKAAIDRLEEELMQKDGAINLLKERIEMYKSK